MATLRFEATRRFKQLSITFDEAIEERVQLSANVTDHPLEASVSGFEFVNDHSQRKADQWSVEAIVTETPFSNGQGKIPDNATTRVASAFAILDERLDQMCYYTTARLGVQGPLLLEGVDLMMNNRDSAVFRLDFKAIRFALSERVSLPPAVPKRAKKKKEKGDQTKKKDQSGASKLVSELALGPGVGAFVDKGFNAVIAAFQGPAK